MTRSLAPFRRETGARLLALLLVTAAVWTWTGCSVVRLASGENGADVKPIQPGAARAAAEAILGSPVREWTSPTSVRYRTYEYDSGCPPRPADAAAAVFMNIITLGLWEVFTAIAEWKQGKDAFPCIQRTTDQVVIAYDDRDLILGIFNEFDDLPPDGRSGRREWK